jgi:UDP:flavonoid glycosyltransferase YjiC (YdhE family)
MRLTIVALGSRGAVQPYVALGLGLRAAGHAVRIAAYPEFEPMVRGSGLAFAPITRNPDELTACAQSDAWISANPLRAVRWLSDLVGPVLRRGLADCDAACRDADVVCYSTVGWLLAQHVAEHRGIRAVAALLQPATPTGAFAAAVWPQRLEFPASWNRLTYRALARLFWRALRGAVDRARAEVLDLPPATRRIPFAEGNGRDPVLYGFSPSVVPPPPDWPDRVHVTGYWFLDTPADWAPPTSLERFLESGPRPVYLGFGSMRSRSSHRLPAIVTAALERSGQRAVLLMGDGIAATALPDSVLAVESVPHDWLFQRVAAVAHHGGGGTTAAGLRAGVPTVTVPFFGDQPFWGWRVHRLGAGPPPIPRKRLDARRLSRALGLALGDGRIRERARALGERIRGEDGVSRAVEVFERWASAGR